MAETDLTPVTVTAPAKINLALHVTGRRADGYHLLSSLVVFAGSGDRLSVAPARGLSLRVTGPMAAGVPDDRRNIVWRAAEALAHAQGRRPDVAITLEKHLPHGAGIGGGSSDGAATLRALRMLWGGPPLSASACLALGADVPVCVAGPAPQLMTGIGERVSPAPILPEMWLCLVNPGIAVPTGAVFAALRRTDGAPLDPMPAAADFARVAAWLSAQRNDLSEAAEAIAPDIAVLRARMAAQPGCALARMSGSGSTVFGLFATRSEAEGAAAAMQAPGHWVAAARVLGGADGEDQLSRKALLK